MPPRFAYWTIILEGTATAFRAHTPEELLPTLRQLQSRHPDAVMKWFARGRLWDSPEQERMVAAMKKRAPRDRRPDDWRPGGEHRDPRARFSLSRDEKRRRFAAKVRRDRTDAPPAGPPAPRERGTRPAGDHRPDRHRDRPPQPARGETRRENERGDAPRPEFRGGKPPWKKEAARRGGPAGRPPHRSPRGPVGRGGKGGGGRTR